MSPFSGSGRSAWQAEHIFPTLFAIFGLAFAFGMPPCQVADENSHFRRAYHVSDGHLAPAIVSEWGGGYIPVNILRIEETFAYLVSHPESHATRKDFAQLPALPLNPEVRRVVPFPGSAYYSFVPYVPQALGIALARWLGFGPLAIFYAGRLANLLLTILLISWAIRVTPFFKLVFGTIALLPITVHQCASLSPDASTIGVAFLFVAVLFRLACGGKISICPEAGGQVENSPPQSRVSSFAAIVAMLGLAGWLTLCKFPYAPLSLLYYAVPSKQFGGWRRHYAAGTGLFLLVFGLSVVLTGLKKYTPDRIARPAKGASISGQMELIRKRPLRFARVCAVTVAAKGRIWIEELGTLGWLDTPITPLALQAFLIWMVIVGLGDRTAGIYPNTRLKVAGLLSVILCGGIILTSCYVCGCSIKASLVDGVQGRYFIPLLPVLMLFLYNRTVSVQVQPGVLLALSAAACAGIQLVAVAAFVRRYYFTPDVELRLAPAALGTALLLFVAVATVAHQRQIRASLGKNGDTLL